jgi:hypothetical protein
MVYDHGKATLLVGLISNSMPHACRVTEALCEHL